MRHRSTAFLTAAAILVAAAGCGSSGHAKHASAPASPAEQVRAVVLRYGQASARKDFVTICQQLLAARLTAALAQTGIPCELAFKKGLGSVSHPRLVVGAVTVTGIRAFAEVHTTAANQQPSDDTLGLIRERGAWRISSLTSSGAVSVP